MEEEMMYFQELIEFFKVKEAYKVDGMIEFGMEDFKKLQSLLNRLEQLEKENKELKKYKERCNGAVEFINSRIDSMIPEHYEDLHYILCKSEEGEW